MSNHSIIRITKVELASERRAGSQGWQIVTGIELHPEVLRSMYIYLFPLENVQHKHWMLTLILCKAIAVSCRDVDVRNVKAIIIGPPDTPYEFGFFEVGSTWQIVQTNNSLIILVFCKVRTRYEYVFRQKYKSRCDQYWTALRRLPRKSTFSDRNYHKWRTMPFQPKYIRARQSLLVGSFHPQI